jgi:hypothetical protein
MFESSPHDVKAQKNHDKIISNILNSARRMWLPNIYKVVWLAQIIGEHLSKQPIF